jgi:hypothetical protein
MEKMFWGCEKLGVKTLSMLSWFGKDGEVNWRSWKEGKVSLMHSRRISYKY